MIDKYLKLDEYNINVFKDANQSSSWHNKAVPLSVQKSGWCDLVGRSTGRMKLVLCPVVDKTPALFDVL